MTSNRLILIFLGFIFIIIVVLTSSRISAVLRTRFGSLLPSVKQTIEEVTPTPTIEEITPALTVKSETKTGTSGTVGEIPATGPENFVWLLLSGSLLAGITLKKLTA